MKWTLIISGIVLVILTTVSIIVGFFSAWTFIALLFYTVMYIGGYLFIKVGINRNLENENELYRRKQRFDWCWERANKILKQMPGGQGLQWASGVGRKSLYKTFYDGIQNKPFRSILAHTEDDQQLTLIIYNIDNDDISAFITNPSPLLIDNPWNGFKPFSRGVGNEGRYDRNGYDEFGGNYPSRNNRGVNIQVGNDDFGNYRKPRQPTGDSVDRALETLERK